MRCGAGVATIYQDLALASRLPDLAERVRRRGAHAAAAARRAHPRQARDARTRRRAISRASRSTSATPIAPIERLSGGQRQAVAIARALHWNARLVIMDEPTAALGVAESRQVLDLIRELHRGGTTVILISHNMAEVVDVATRVVVFKGGRKIADRPAAGLTADDLAHLVMVGTDSARGGLKDCRMARTRIIIDTDPGQDDAVAILLALAERDALDLVGHHDGRRQCAAAADHGERAADPGARAARRRARVSRREPAAAARAAHGGVRLRRRRSRRRGPAAAAPRSRRTGTR